MSHADAHRLLDLARSVAGLGLELAMLAGSVHEGADVPASALAKRELELRELVAEIAELAEANP